MNIGFLNIYIPGALPTELPSLGEINLDRLSLSLDIVKRSTTGDTVTALLLGDGNSRAEEFAVEIHWNGRVKQKGKYEEKDTVT